MAERRGPEAPDLSERGGMKNGQPQRSDVRLFMQFLAFGGCENSQQLVEGVRDTNVAGVLYEDVTLASSLDRTVPSLALPDLNFKFR